ncbi:glycosyltransferase [Mucilaginibacter robiniae]|uniref:Glycosyltransferase n=1 Tax=Mucilaginibacter robiniae TaxID=2728022 RepID=A0A7L5E9D6_9SPHI|nr:glycosyltransferase [Mucilaginibacter robiniae]QJD97493.1 glycosyltransferase [Mucilaginibacter robiniae]
MGFLLLRQRRIAAYRLPEVEPNSLPISVIISARNEAENLQRYLPTILEQLYPTFEVVVVNDCSVDDSHNVLLHFSEKYPHLKLVTVTEHRKFKTGKKFALTMGIKAARYEHLLFTDADCEPASENWITLMAQNFTGTTEIVLGYSPYRKTAGFLNAFIRFETLRTAINYLSAALGRKAYMGIGRNLAYTKSLFFKRKGFASHLHVLSGDDDLFVNQNATADNTVIEIHPGAFTYSEAKSTFSSYFRQKKRHMGVGGLYKARHKWLLSLDAVSGFLFYILLVLSLYYRLQPLVLGSVYVLKLLVQWIVFRKAAHKLGNASLLWFLPFWDLIYYVYLNVFGLIGTFIKTTRWK